MTSSCYVTSQRKQGLLGAFFENKMWNLMMSMKKNPLFVYGWDRKICLSGSPCVIIRQASRCQTVILKTIRIFHECEGGIEKSVRRIAIWHQEARQVMTNGDPEGQIFLSYPHTHERFFFLLTTVFFILK